MNDSIIDSEPENKNTKPLLFQADLVNYLVRPKKIDFTNSTNGRHSLTLGLSPLSVQNHGKFPE